MPEVGKQQQQHISVVVGGHRSFQWREMQREKNNSCTGWNFSGEIEATFPFHSVKLQESYVFGCGGFNHREESFVGIPFIP